MTPLVSIGLPTYNRASCLSRTLESLLAQSCRNFELIISDDASADGTEKLCREYAKRDSRIRYFRQKKNLGVKGNFYFVFSQARGEYFMRAGDDDWWARDCVEKLVRALEGRPEYVLALSSFARVYNNGEVEEEITFEGTRELSKLSSLELYKNILLRKRGLDHGVYGLIRRPHLASVLQKPILRDKGWDAILLSELSLLGRFYSLPEILRFSNNKLEYPGERKSKMSPQPWQKLKKPKFRFVSTTYANLFLGSLGRVLFSRAVPWPRKFLVFGPWFQALWIKRRKMFGSFYGEAHKNYSVGH